MIRPFSSDPVDASHFTVTDMHDQADELRQLVRQGLYAGHVNAPSWITVAGGKGGVGTTTIALGLATSLAAAGRRVVLVDGDFGGPNLAAFTAVEPRYTICDVLTSRRGVHEALEAGPGGLQLLLGPSPNRQPVECSPVAQQRLVEQLKCLGAHADIVVVDAGAGISRVMRRFWQAADDLVLVTTTDSVAVMDTYAALKQLYTREPNQTVHAMINNVADPAESHAVGARLSEACRRFLAVSLGTVTSLQHDKAQSSASSLAGGEHAPDAAGPDAPRGSAARRFDDWVERWSTGRGVERRPHAPLNTPPALSSQWESADMQKAAAWEQPSPRVTS